MSAGSPAGVSGYVLAGGKSVRMGRDKALLELDGRPLIQHAVEKLRAVCADVHILSSRPELAVFAPLVPDLHRECGPLGGIEAALLHSACDWNLFLPVDMPFVPGEFLSEWVQQIAANPTARVALFSVDGHPQPTLCMLHRHLTPYVQHAIDRAMYKVLPVLEEAAATLARADNVDPSFVLVHSAFVDRGWFANLNTPAEFADAASGFKSTQADAS